MIWQDVEVSMIRTFFLIIEELSQVIIRPGRFQWAAVSSEPPLLQSSRYCLAANVGCECSANAQSGALACHVHPKQEFRRANYRLGDPWCAAAVRSLGRSMQSSAAVCGIEQQEPQT